MKLSIKLRVTLLCTLLSAMIAAAALIALVAGEQRMLQDYYLNSLVATAQLAHSEIVYEDGELEIDRDLDDLPSTHIAVYSLEGDLVYGRRRVELPFEEAALRRTEDDAGNDWFVYDSLLRFDGGPSLWLRCVQSAEASRGLLNSRSRMGLLIFPVLILLAGVGGYFIAWRAFHPVARIVRTAESIADGADLKKRIELRGAKDELYDLARTFDAMFERLDRAFEREQQFTSDASHELRTPVTSILTQSEFALSPAATEADRAQALAQIHAKAADMAELIRRLLLLARMDAGHLPLEWEHVDMGLLAELASESLQDAAAARHMLLEARCVPAVVWGDQTMLMQAVLNLVENAVRHGREGGHICVRVEISEDVRLYVEDDGPGIPAESLPHLFERFYQTDASRHSGGAGLGLSLVWRIARLHGGDVGVQSGPGIGTVFTLRLPKSGEST